MKAIIIILLLLPLAGAYSFTEIHYDPVGGDEGHEWVELRGAPLSTDMRFVEDGGSHTLRLVQGSCFSDCVLLIADDAETLLADYTINPETLVYDSAWGSLRNDGETLLLKQNDHTLAEATYPDLASPGESINFNGAGWEAATPTPGTTPTSAVPEFGKLSGLLLLTLIGFWLFSRNHK